MNLLKTILIFVLLIFPLGEVIRIDFGNGFIAKPLDIGVGVIVLSWLAIKLFKKQKIAQIKILIAVVLFTLSGLFSLLINSMHLTMTEFLVSFSYLIRWVAYAGTFFVVSDFDKEFKKKILDLLLVSGSLIVGLGYLQYFFYPNLKNLYYLGWDEHLHRMFSVFLDPNFAGAFFVLFFLFLANLFFKKKNLLVGLLLALTLGAVFLTFSRSALIMLIVSSSLFFVLMNKKMWIAILMAITVLVLVMSSGYFNIENVNLFRAVSAEARLKTAGEAIGIIQNHPVFGIGFNAYRYAKFNYRLKAQNAEIISHADAGTDNSFLFVLATTGIIGLIAYIFLWLRILRIASVLAIASIVGVFINSLFINSLFYSFIMLWLWIIIAIKVNK